ncbi:hypothetical protein M231_03725 [Tremella mesenterica]|uniref:Uncharacterized protein n=1 Tax=Tremella mesenterica TaxID=5217 RepID=A0A4Q1BME3_TREME|nr:hypothetical protein M231_03725 [Tremella mesenterica]
MTRMLEMIIDPSVNRVSISEEMERWWIGQVRRGRLISTQASGSDTMSLNSTHPPTSSSIASISASSSSLHNQSSTSRETPESSMSRDTLESSASHEEIKKPVDVVEPQEDREQWGHKLPGHGGT